MKSTVEQLNAVQYRLSIEVSPDEVNKAFDGAYRKLQQRARIQGFRPGKAPLTVVRRLYGNSVAGEVHESLINQHLFAAIGEQAFRPVAAPVVDAKSLPTENETFIFTAVVDVLPELKIDNYKGVEVSAEEYAVNDEALNRELSTLRRRSARTRPIEPGQTAAKGMLAALSHTATHKDVAIAALDVKDMTVALGEGELFDGLEAPIFGMTVGQVKTAPVKLPDTYPDKELAGQELSFTLTLNDLKVLDIPALDDEFAKDLNFESAQLLTDEVRKQMESQATNMSRQSLETALLGKILDANPFEVPPAMVDQVIDSMIEEELRGHPEDTRKKALGNSELRKNLLATAKRRTQNTLVLWHVAQKEAIETTEAELNQRLDQVLADAGVTDPKQKATFRKSLEPRLRESVLFEKAMDFLLENAKVTRVPASL
ncbi:MAG: trigger factor [Deltaproteobacteria bacterium]|nr:trigger factor [Deltaproteobacteria bacterium]